MCKKIKEIGGISGCGDSNSIVIFKRLKNAQILFKNINNYFLKVPYGYVYLIGENLDDSKDSREYGALPYGLLKSRVLLKVVLEIKLR